MDKIEIFEKLKEFADKVNSIYQPESIYLFGSYSRGNWHKYSDIDAAIIFDKNIDNRYEIMRNILKLRRNIDLRIEPLIFEIDNDPSGLLNTIFETGDLIYKRN